MSGFSKVLRTPCLFVLWAIAAYYIYGALHDGASGLREFVFDHYCPQEVKYPFDEPNIVNGNKGRVDWCDTWWWHPFRLLTRIVIGVVAPITIFLLLWWLRLRSLNASIFAAVFVLLMCHTHTVVKTMAPMSFPIQGACATGHEVIISRDECRIILGTYGDQRIYYPLMTFMGFVTLLGWRRWVSSKTSAQATEQALELRGS